MRFNETGGFEVEGQTEARVVAHFFLEQGDERCLNMFEPPLPHRKIGWLAFASSRIEDFFGTSDEVTHVVADESAAKIVAKHTILNAVPRSLFGPSRFSRRRYLQRRLEPIYEAVRESDQELHD